MDQDVTHPAGSKCHPSIRLHKGASCANSIDAYRARDVFEVLLADIGKYGVDFATDLAKRVFRDADTAGLGDTFEPGGDIDPIAEDVVTLDQYIAKMDADAPFHTAVAGHTRIAFRAQLLQRQSAFDGADHRTELDQDPVAGGLDDPSAISADQRVGGSTVLAQCLCRTRLVFTHQAAVAGDIGSEDGGDTADGSHSQLAAILYRDCPQSVFTSRGASW